MEDVLYYLLKVSIGTTVFYLTYHLLFRKSKQFVFNRFYLAGSALASFIIPLITFKTTSYLSQAGIYFSGTVSGGGVLEPATSATEAGRSIGFPEMLLTIYLAGMIYYLIKLIYGYTVAAGIRKRCTEEMVNGIKVYVSEDNIRAFTFWDRIIMGKNILNHPSITMVLNHESVHSREKHFYDIIIAELLFMLQWYNPFARLHTQAIRNNLEFRADDMVIRESDIQAYLSTMLSMVQKRVKPPLFTELNSSNLKKRIIMMKSKSQNRFAGLARLALIPVLAVLLASLSGKETVVLNDDMEKNEKFAHTGMQPKVMEETPQDTLKSREEILRYVSENIKYPAEARKSGHIGTVELYALVSQKGTIKEVLELQPDEGFVEIEEIVIIGYTGVESEHTESSDHMSLRSEGRRVIESFPVLEIPELYGQTMKLTFKFDIR
jgi:hypothetical protein